MNNIAKSGVNPCCGCGICVVSCPHNAIVFSHNNEGFLKPTVDNVKCTDCGICTKVCYKYLEEKKPFANTFENKPVYAAWSKNRATVLSSSSGGVGFELTSYYFEQGYNICGCIFDAPNDCCKHIIVRSEDGLEAIKTSKYLQSNTVGAFSQFKKSEKQVVIGTPCQIYGLRKWIQLKKWEENFILVDFFCHGTPSFNLWKKYKEYISKNYNLNSKFESVNFRKKNPESKWHKNAISIRDFSGKQFEKGRAFAEDLFFKFFLNNSCLSESCYNCVLRLDHCAADIRIADFWGSKYAGNDDGVSLVITNTEKGENAFDTIKGFLIVEECTFDDLQHSQSVRFLPLNNKREKIIKELQNSKPLDRIYWKHFGALALRQNIRKGLSKIKRMLLK